LGEGELSIAAAPGKSTRGVLLRTRLTIHRRVAPSPSEQISPTPSRHCATVLGGDRMPSALPAIDRPDDRAAAAHGRIITTVRVRARPPRLANRDLSIFWRYPYVSRETTRRLCIAVTRQAISAQTDTQTAIAAPRSQIPVSQAHHFLRGGSRDAPSRFYAAPIRSGEVRSTLLRWTDLAPPVSIPHEARPLQRTDLVPRSASRMPTLSPPDHP
jgi:hypothetical protein